MDDERHKLKLGKGVRFVKGVIRRLPQEGGKGVRNEWHFQLAQLQPVALNRYIGPRLRR